MEALSTVSERVTLVGALLAHAFVRGYHDPDEMGLCPICQDDCELGGNGVLQCGHVIMWSGASPPTGVLYL